jgi:hypothetical protein
MEISSRTTRTTSHTSNHDRFVVGWAAAVVQIWPEEDETIGAELLADLRRPAAVEQHLLAS